MNVHKWTKEEVAVVFPVQPRRKAVRFAASDNEHGVNGDDADDEQQFQDEANFEDEEDEEMVDASDATTLSTDWATINGHPRSRPQLESKRIKCPVSDCDYTSERLADVRRHVFSKVHRFPEDIARAYFSSMQSGQDEQQDTNDHEHFDVESSLRERSKQLSDRDSALEHDYMHHFEHSARKAEQNMSTTFNGEQGFNVSPPRPRNYMGTNFEVRFYSSLRRIICTVLM
jgi:hypothetical protein